MDNLPIINRSYDVYKLVIDLTGSLDKRWRYSLGESLEQSIMACLSELIMAKNAPKPLKPTYLLRASSHLEISMLKLANETKLFQAQGKLEEIGRMLGGWLKSLR